MKDHDSGTDDINMDTDSAMTRDESTGIVRATWSDHAYPTTAVVEAVAAATNRDSARMAPLHEEINTDALDALLSSAASGSSNGLSVSFRYDGVAVTVYGDGDLEVRPHGANAEG